MNRISQGPTKFTLETEYDDKAVTITGEAVLVEFEHTVDYDDVHTMYGTTLGFRSQERTDVHLEIVQPYTVVVTEKPEPEPVKKVLTPLPPQEVVLWKK